ncbi:MAG: hypothetical protein PHE96_02030 [Methylococcales bacterium]|nr:hypothetical protein [Methylococcales bacterium]
MKSLELDSTDDVVKQWVLNQYSQIGTIASQLVNNLNIWVQKNPKEQNSRSEYLGCIIELIIMLRGCIRYAYEDEENFWLDVSLDWELTRHPEIFLNKIVNHHSKVSTYHHRIFSS